MMIWADLGSDCLDCGFGLGPEESRECVRGRGMSKGCSTRVRCPRVIVFPMMMIVLFLVHERPGHTLR